MTDLERIPLEAFTGGGVTTDGLRALLRCKRIDGTEFVLAFPKAHLFQLIDLLAKEFSRGELRQGFFEKRDVSAFNVLEYSLGTSEESVILSLTFGAGGTLHFHLPGSLPEQLLETLEVATGRTVPPSPTNLQ